MRWRAILDGEHSGSWNMAMDAAILDAVSDGIALPTVRVYTWDEPTVTFGRHQNVEAGIAVDYCEEHAIPIIRRSTGGRGILHGTDLTVSVAMGLEALPPSKRSVVESYRYLSEGFVGTLRELGIEGEMGECGTSTGGAGDCFAVTSRADVVIAAGQKLVGSAQRRRGGFLLQQSSIRYQQPEIKPDAVFHGTVDEGQYPLENVPEERLARAVITGFAGLLGPNCEIVAGASAWEEERCAVLLREFPSLFA